MSVGRIHHGGTPIDDPTPSSSSTSGDAGTTPSTPARGTHGGSRTRADVVRGIGDVATSAGDKAKVLQMIDGAKTRVLMKIQDLKDQTLLEHLKDAANRGVNVQVYMVSAAKGSGKTVLDEEGLEASGVDCTVDRTDHLPGAPLVVADDKALVKGSGGPTVSSDAAAIRAAAAAFAAATREKTGPALGAPPANGVRLLAMPEATGAEIVAQIAGAKKSIDLEVYQLEDPNVVAVLQDAAKRGVKVRVMLEPKTVGAANFKPVAAALRKAGVEVKETPPDFDTHRNVDHAKFMVIDGKELLFGTGNLVRSGLGGNPAQEFDNRDFWVEDGRATSAAEGKTLFQDDWDRKSTAGVDFKNLVLTPDNADRRILDLIDGARRRCFVYNQSLSDPKVIEKLIAAKRRGADVRVLLGFQPGFGGPPKNQAAIDQLKAAGIPAAYLTKNYLHAKGVVSDDKAFVGSQNFTGGGLVNNRELGEILDDPAAVKKVADTFLADQG